MTGSLVLFAMMSKTFKRFAVVEAAYRKKD